LLGCFFKEVNVAQQKEEWIKQFGSQIDERISPSALLCHDDMLLLGRAMCAG